MTRFEPRTSDVGSDRSTNWATGKLAAKLLAKEVQMIGNFLGYFEKPHSFAKTSLATFRATFGKMGYILL